jgi:hypothetical protein
LTSIHRCVKQSMQRTFACATTWAQQSPLWRSEPSELAKTVHTPCPRRCTECNRTSKLSIDWANERVGALQPCSELSLAS